MKRFKCRLRRLKKQLAYYLLGYYPVDHDLERQKNIDYLFRVVYEWKDNVANKYDYYYHISHNDNIARKDTLEFYTEPNLIIA